MRLLRALARYSFWEWVGGNFVVFRFLIPPKPGAKERSDLDVDLMDEGEPQVSLPDAEISEKERREAVRRYQRELREKSQR